MYKRYERYKDSGIEWIGEIPEHWDLKQLKHVCKIIMGQSPSSDEYNINQYGLPFLQGNAEFGKQNPTPKLYCRQPNKKAKKGDILLSVRAPVGALNIADREYGIGRGLCAIRSYSVNNNYSWYLMHGVLNELYLMMTGSTYDAVSAEDVKNVTAIVPMLNEQKAIANYLDLKTSEIDSLIADKEKLIEKLEEYKQSIITEAVTKGLNPNVKIKDSGIEWIGDIPEHWDVKKVKHITSYIGSGKTPRGGSEVYPEHGVLFLRSQNIYPDGLWLKEKIFIDEEMDHEMKNTRVKRQDVLLNITGASIGRASIVPDDFPRANVNQHVCILRSLIMKVVPSLLHIIITSKYLQSQIFMHQSGSSREGLNFEQVGNLMIALPPIEEQREINIYLYEKTKLIDVLANDINTAINKLKEYRQSLIYEAVTGKIDVREYQTERSEQLA